MPQANPANHQPSVDQKEKYFECILFCFMGISRENQVWRQKEVGFSLRCPSLCKIHLSGLLGGAEVKIKRGTVLNFQDSGSWKELQPS